ncbi:MAG: hypothetical protein Kow00122_14730 [Thermoleophilia bacterium]
MKVFEQIQRLREQQDVGLPCSVIGPEDVARRFVALLKGIEIVRVRAIYVVGRGGPVPEAWQSLLERELDDGSLPEGVTINEGPPSLAFAGGEGEVYFDLVDALEPPVPSAGVLVVGEPGCHLLTYFLEKGVSTGSAADALFQLFSFFSEAQKREQRLALRLEEVRKAYLEVEQRLAETFFTHEFFKALTVYEPLRKVASMVVDGTLGIMGAESCALYIKDEGDPPLLRLYAAQGQGLDCYGAEYPGAGEWVDLRLKDSDGGFAPILRPEVFAELVPGTPGVGAVLSRKDDLLGLLLVASKDLEYGPLELERFLSVAGMAALSLQNVLLHEEIEKRAITDQLTGLYNHRFFQQALEQEFVRAKTAHSSFSLIMIDLDYFKELNDTYGHLLGDMFLRRVGEAIRASVRESDIPARYGGDEFALILPGTALAGAKVVAEKIFESVRQIALEVPDGMVSGRTVSVGVAALLPECHTPKDLFDLADQALYVAKENGRSQIRVYGDAEV